MFVSVGVIVGVAVGVAVKVLIVIAPDALLVTEDPQEPETIT